MCTSGRVNLGRMERLETYGVTPSHAVEREKPAGDKLCFESQRTSVIKPVLSVSLSCSCLQCWWLSARLMPAVLAGVVPPALGQVLLTSAALSDPAGGSLSKHCEVSLPRRRQRYVIKELSGQQIGMESVSLGTAKGKSFYSCSYQLEMGWIRSMWVWNSLGYSYWCLASLGTVLFNVSWMAGVTRWRVPMVGYGQCCARHSSHSIVEAPRGCLWCLTSGREMQSR